VDLAAYRRQVLALLPRGAAWEGPNLRKIVAAFAAEVHRIAEAGGGPGGAIDEAIPATTSALLPDYERLVGLPYPGFDLAGTDEERRADVLAVLIAQGGQSKAYFLALIAARGHVGARIVDGYRPFVAGSLCGTPLYGEAWAFHWRVEIAEPGPDLLLEFLIERYRPAHTTVSFVYDSP
jgi:uncharacterized protein YmfQ (DUF2313 family)